MQSLRLPHTYRPPLLPAPPPAHCQGSPGAAATLSQGSVLPFHSGVHVPLPCTRILVHGHTCPCRCCAGTCARAASARTQACSELLACVLAYPLCQHRRCSGSLVAQAGPAHADARVLHHGHLCRALVTVSDVQGDTLPSLPVAVMGMRLSRP